MDPVILWFLVVFFAIIASMMISLLFPKRFSREAPELSPSQQGAVKRQSQAIAIVLFAFVFLWVLSWVWKSLFSETAMPFALEMSQCFWTLTMGVGLFVGISAVLKRVLVLTARGSKSYPVGSCAVVEGLVIIAVILLVWSYCRFPF